MSVPDNNEFTLQDVVDEIENQEGPIDPDSLSNCFANANANQFDFRYALNKDRLSNFRNYGINGILEYKSVKDDGTALTVSTDGTYLFVSWGSSINMYSVNQTTGVLTLIDSYVGGFGYTDVWCQSSKVYVGLGNDGIGVFTYNAGGFITMPGQPLWGDNMDDQGGTYNWVSGDGTEFIYSSRSEAGSGYFQIYDESLNHKDEYGLPGLSFKRGTYFNGYITVGELNGLYTFSYDDVGETLSYEDDDQTYHFWDVLVKDNLLFAVAGINGLVCLSSLADIESEDFQGTTEQYLGIAGVGQFIIVGCEEDGLRSYKYDLDGNLYYMDTQDDGSSYGDVAIVGNIICAACGADGIRTYVIT